MLLGVYTVIFGFYSQYSNLIKVRGRLGTKLKAKPVLYKITELTFNDLRLA